MQRHRTPAALAAPAAGRAGGATAGTPEGAVLLAALLLACLYAACAHGATDAPAETRLQVGLAALALAALALWAGGRGIAWRAPRATLVGVLALAGFAAWSGLSLLWSASPDATWTEVNRAIAYALVAALAVAAGGSARAAIERAAVGWLLVAVVVALYALGGKVIPSVHLPGIDFDHTDTISRLRAPLQYWNALALVCVLAIPVAVRLAVDRTRAPGQRLLGLAAIFLLGSVQGMTYSRGGVLGVVVAVAVLTWLAGGRWRGLAAFALAAAAVAPVLAVAFTLDGLTTNGAPLHERAHDGRILGAVMLGCLTALVFAGHRLLALDATRAAGPRWDAVSRTVARTLGLAGATIIFLGAVAVAGAPNGAGHAVAHRLEHFTDVQQDDQYDPARLATTNSGNRWVWWQEAVGAWSDRPVGGWGAGSFPVTHLWYRENAIPVAQPHSVPLQFLAETGLLGLLLAVAGIGGLAVAAVGRVRGMPAGRERDLAAALVAGAAAWVVHGFYDWDWDIPGVTLPALLFLGVVAAWPHERATLFVDPARGQRGGFGRGLAVGAATLALSAFATSAILPAVAASKASGAQDAAGGEQVSDAQLRDAAAQAQLGAKLDPLSADPLFASASIAIRRGRLLEARDDLLDAVRRQPDDALAWSKLATVAAQLADRQGFEDAALRALALDPRNPRLRTLAERAVAFRTPPSSSATAVGTPLPLATPAAAP